LIHIKTRCGAGWSNHAVTKCERHTEQAKIWRDCIARRAGACGMSTASCLECGPVRQALRTAGWVQCRWPHLDSRLRD
jgi:hypothetical protein